MRSRRCRRRRTRRRRSGCTCTSRSAGSAATSATSASTPTRTRRRSGATSTCSREEWELYARQPAIARPAAELRLLRRRHAVVPVDARSCRALVKRLTARHAVEPGGRDHVRVRARHADRAQAEGDPQDGRHAPEPRRRELRRPHPRDQRPRPPLARDRDRLPLRARARLPADQHRPDRRHARRDRGELAAQHREDDRARARQRHHLPDGAALQHDDHQGPAPEDRADDRHGRRLGDQAALGAGGVRRARARRLSHRQRLHRRQGSGEDEVRLPRSPVAGSRHGRPRRRVVRPRQRRPRPEQGHVGDLQRGHRPRRAAARRAPTVRPTTSGCAASWCCR